MPKKKYPKKASKTKKEKPNKLGAIKKEVDGIKFDSTMEADYYVHLKAQKEAGLVANFDLQPEFVLLQGYKKYGRTIRPIKYIADFRVVYPDGSEKIIDVKGRATADFKLKRKMFDFYYPDKILQLVVGINSNKEWVDYDEHNKAKRKAKKAKKEAESAK